MAYVSKLLFDSKVKNCDCKDIIHKWHPDCIKAGFMFLKGSTKGICSFFFVMYTAQYLLRRKWLTKKDIKRITVNFLRSVIFGHAFAASPIILNCLQSYIFGNFNYYITTFGSGAMMGMTTIMSPKDRFPIEATYFNILAVECCIKYLSLRNIFPKSKSSGTAYFMLLNALMMALLWNKQNLNENLDINWIFKPFTNKEHSNNKICSHNGNCIRDCMQVTKKYVVIGTAISLIRLIVNIFRKKDIYLYNVINKSFLTLPLLLSCYVGVYKIVHCFLNHLKGKDDSTHAAIAGFISGITYCIKPNLSLIASSLVLITMAIFKEIKKKINLPNFPYQYMAFILSCSIIIHFCIVDRKLAPTFILLMLSNGTNGRSTEIFDNIEIAVCN